MSGNVQFTSVFFVPYKHNYVALWDIASSQWILRQGNSTGFPISGRTANLPFDVFVEWNGSGFTLTFVNWTNATTRAGGALTQHHGVWVQGGALNRRFVGTVLPNAATSGLWRETGDGASASFVSLGVWNQDNRVVVHARHIESTNTWTYQTNTWRVARAASNFMQIINGAVGVGWQDAIQIGLLAHSSQSAANARWVTIGWGQTPNAGTATPIPQAQAPQISTTALDNMPCNVAHSPSTGVNTYAWLEKSTASGTTTWQGDNNATGLQSGMSLLWMA